MENKNSLIIGPHIHKRNHKTYQDALATEIINMTDCGIKPAACQIFVMGPQNSNLNFNEQSAKEFGDYAAAQKIKIIVHNSYLISLWNANISRRPFARINIKKQLEYCDIMGAKGFVIHLPDESAEDIKSELDHIKPENYKTPIYLETKAQRPSTISYEKTERIDVLFTLIKSPHIGLCIDTAHLWSSGVSMTHKPLAIKWFFDLSQCAGGDLWGFLENGEPKIMFHLNDADNEFASGKDVHAELGHGNIWREEKSGLKEILQFIYKSNIITILERNKTGIEKDCQTIKELLDIK